MAGFKVTPGELKAAEGNLRTVAERIRAELDAARKEATRLSSEWTGQGQDRFQQLMSEWDKVAKAQQDNLLEVSKALGVAAENYANAEDAAKRSFQGG